MTPRLCTHAPTAWPLDAARAVLAQVAGAVPVAPVVAERLVVGGLLAARDPARLWAQLEGAGVGAGSFGDPLCAAVARHVVDALRSGGAVLPLPSDCAGCDVTAWSEGARRAGPLGPHAATVAGAARRREAWRRRARVVGRGWWVEWEDSGEGGGEGELLPS